MAKHVASKGGFKGRTI